MSWVPRPPGGPSGRVREARQGPAEAPEGKFRLSRKGLQEGFNNQHTKSPKNQCRMYVLDLMSKVPKLLDETRSNGEWFSTFSTFLQNC